MAGSIPKPASSSPKPSPSSRASRIRTVMCSPNPHHTAAPKPSCKWRNTRRLMPRTATAKAATAPPSSSGISHQALLDGLGTAGTPDGKRLPAAAARRMACDAGIIPAVYGSDSQILDFGRLTRTIPAGLRRFIVARDGGCVWPGCDRPPAWTEVHHREHWARDKAKPNPTNLDLLCAHHHHKVPRRRLGTHHRQRPRPHPLVPPTRRPATPPRPTPTTLQATAPTRHRHTPPHVSPQS